MEFKFAEYSKQDISKFVELGKEVLNSDACHKYGNIQSHLHDVWMSASFKYNKNKKSRYLLVCYDNGKPIASMLVLNSLFHIFNDLVFELHVYVDKEYRRKNIATDMLNYILNVTDIKKQYLYSKGVLEKQGEDFYLKHGIHFFNFEYYVFDIYLDWENKKCNIKTAKEELKRRLDIRFECPVEDKTFFEKVDGPQTKGKIYARKK